MKRYNKIICLLYIILTSLILFACNNDPVVDPEPEPHDCVASEWTNFTEDFKCGDIIDQYKYCTICGEELETRSIRVTHEYAEEITEPTCTESGKKKTYCKNCDYSYENYLAPLGHTASKFEIIETATATTPGKKVKKCVTCGKVLNTVDYIENGYHTHGKLSVVGTDLVDCNGDKFQLYGLSTHGLQWFGSLVNYDGLSNLVGEFGNNILRFSLYTAEGGYCECNEATKKKLLNTLIEGVEIATELGIYALIDWHMLGAEDERDENPLFYLEESKEFFSYISEYFKDYDNVLYEIMNEPSGSATWKDCKKYAEEVIPCIRKNTDGIILVGNAHWSSDLYSVLANPLVGYSNIMYTYHFYANDIKSPSDVIYAYKKGLPVFISEYGFMDSDGDGVLNYTAGNAWYKALDERNISYIAWSIANSYSSSSIMKLECQDTNDWSDDNLREWGIFLKKTYRAKAGLPEK